MKISFAITVCNEFTEIRRLLPFLLQNKRPEDEVVILFDEKNGSDEVLNFLLPYNNLPNIQTWRGVDFNNDFAEWKNKLNSYCGGDYIFQLDADELISEYMIKNIHEIVDLNPEVDLFYIPRKNLVDGITEEHVNKWKWRVNESGWINFPDYQGRIYKKGLKWFGKVHERITSGRMYSLLPTDEEQYFITHHKTIERQEKQNEFYNRI